MVAAPIFHPVASLQSFLHRASKLKQFRLLLVILLPQGLHLRKKNKVDAEGELEGENVVKMRVIWKFKVKVEWLIG